LICPLVLMLIIANRLSWDLGNGTFELVMSKALYMGVGGYATEALLFNAGGVLIAHGT
jgi:hypothetical protein